jgi:hypothetical protein
MKSDSEITLARDLKIPSGHPNVLHTDFNPIIATMANWSRFLHSPRNSKCY